MPCLPLSLRLRAKSTTQSPRSAVCFVDLVVREGMTLEPALQKAKVDAEGQKAWGQAALDAAAAAGLSNGAFEDSEDENAAVAEEFYTTAGTDSRGLTASSTAETLAERLEAKTANGAGATA